MLPPRVPSVFRTTADVSRAAAGLVPSDFGTPGYGPGPAPIGVSGRACDVGYSPCTDGLNRWCCQDGSTCGGTYGTCNM